MTTVRLSDELGSTLVGRIPARELRERIEVDARAGGRVVLDFAGVEAISPSFADEVFARLDLSLVDSGAVQLVNLSDHLLEVAGFFRRAAAG